MVATITLDYFNTEQGLEHLVTSSYNALRFKYGWIDGAYNFEMGTDIGWVGNRDVSSFSSNQWRASGSGNVFLSVFAFLLASFDRKRMSNQL